MKIGLSFSRCVLDIVEQRVDINDVLIVIARTNFDPNVDTEWTDIWNGYRQADPFSSSNPEWFDHPEEDQDKFRAVAMMLYNDGKMHQPRKFGARAARRNEFWLETVLPSSELERNPMARKAWETFQTVAGLASVSLDKDYQ
jgi:hypothetical protein